MTSVMHDFLEPRVAQPITEPFYLHPYGGIAKDIYVTLDQFARFFRVSVEYVESLNVNSKILDDMWADGETLGYKIQDAYNGPITYRITVISNRASDHQRHLNRVFKKWEFN